MDTTLHDSLKMSHLQDQRAQAEADYAEAQNPPEQAKLQDAAMREVEATFDVTYTNLYGKVFRGSFTNKVLTVGEKIKVDVVRARRLMNAPKEAMSDNISGLLLMVSWMEESLKKTPPWFKDIWNIHDEGIVEAVFVKCAAHERCFHGRAEDPEEG